MSSAAHAFTEVQNLFLDAETTPNYAIWSKQFELAEGQILWVRFPFVDQSGSLVTSEGIPTASRILYGRRKPHERVGGLPLYAKRVGNYVRIFALWKGPSYKLSDWKQLPVGMEMMLTPEPDEQEEELSLFRAGYLRRKGFGQFDLNPRSDGSTWVRRR